MANIFGLLVMKIVLLSGSLRLPQEADAVPLNVINVEGMEGVPRMRADYGFYAADNQSAFRGDSYLDLLPAASNIDAISTNAIIQRSGCRYKATVYAPGENVPTEESCLFCHCKGSVVVCKLRVCPEVPDPPPPGCIVVQKANKCCSQLVCHDNHIRKLAREQRLSESNLTTDGLPLPPSALQTLEKGNSCIHEGTVYAEGSAMRSSSLCEHCFCIHGQMKCRSPECLIPLEGCKPRSLHGLCCPSSYDCRGSNQTAVLKTTPNSTPVPQFLKGCRIGGRFIAEGDPILPMQLASQGNNSLGFESLSRCQTCFCMGGVVHCRPLACDRHIEGCRPIMEDGHCCPERYECDKPPKPEGEETTVFVKVQYDTETEAAPTTTQYPEGPSSSTQVYEIRFQKVKARRKENRRKEEEEKNASGSRVTASGGFTSRIMGADVNRGSREEGRKNKDTPEFVPRSFYDDDVREDVSIAQTDDDKFEGSTNSVSDVEEEEIGTTDPIVIIEETTETSKNDVETTENVPVIQDIISPIRSRKDDPDPILPLKLTDDLRLEVASEKLSTLSQSPSPSSTTPAPSTVPSSTPTPTPPLPKTTPEPTTTTSLTEETTVGKLEFISFGMEDALPFSPVNETRYEIYPGQPTTVPVPSYDFTARLGSLIPPASEKQYAKPKSKNASQKAPENLEDLIKISQSPNLGPPPQHPTVFGQDDLRNTIIDVPVQTSLYNNGFFGQGLITDENGKDTDLIITQAEIDDDSKSEEDGDDAPLHHSAKGNPFSKKPETPITTINSNRKFIPSFLPSPSTFPPKGPESPGRTYSKFGIQDSSFHQRYGFPSLDPPSGFEIPLPPKFIDRKVPNFPSNSFQLEEGLSDSGGGSYEDSEGDNNDGSEEFGSYESYLNPHPPPPRHSSKLPSTISGQGQNSFSQRTGVPHIQQVSQQQNVPMITGSGTTKVLSSKDATTKRPDTKIVNSRPLKRPIPTPEDQHLDAGPLDFKPVVAFPFTIPKSPDNFNLGLKLSGCNVYGKYYIVGQIIQELSSICVQCQCSEFGVQCSELQC